MRPICTDNKETFDTIRFAGKLTLKSDDWIYERLFRRARLNI